MSTTARPSAALAATLSFVFPGLGQLALGSVRRGAAFALPALALPLVALIVAGQGLAWALGVLMRQEVLGALLVLNVVLFIYHLAAIGDAWLRGGGSGRGRSRGVVVALVMTTTLVHGTLGVAGFRADEALTAVFGPGPGGNWQIPDPGFVTSPPPSPMPTPTPTPTEEPTASPPPSASPPPAPSPSPTAVPPWAGDGRLDLLLIGSDAGPDRWSLRTDTMVVLSVDVASGLAALFGIPRNMVNVPLPPESADAFPNGRFPGLLNALYVYAMGHPADFPGGEARGFRAVSGAVQELVGVRLDGAVVINLAGFVSLVDALGGLWIDVPERLVDSHYPLENGRGHIAIDIRPGCQKLDGRMALAYARSRRQDSDYGRMRRQQAVLIALARQVDPIALLPRVPDLFEIARDNLWTTLDRSAIPDLGRLAADVDTGRIRTVRFVPPTWPSHVTRNELERMHDVVASVFAEPAPSSTPRPGTTPRPACP